MRRNAAERATRNHGPPPPRARLRPRRSPRRARSATSFDAVKTRARPHINPGMADENPPPWNLGSPHLSWKFLVRAGIFPHARLRSLRRYFGVRSCESILFGKEMKSYSFAQSGRSMLSVFAVAFTALLAVGFFFTASIFGILVGSGLLLLVASGLFSAMRGEEWVLQIDNGILTWDYPRWPRSKGQIDLADVSHIRITDSWVTLTLKDGSRQRLRLNDYPHRFYKYLKECFPGISLDLRNSS